MLKEILFKDLEQEVDGIERIFKLILNDKVIQEFDDRISRLRKLIEALKNLKEGNDKRTTLIDFCKWITVTGAYPEWMQETESVDDYLKSINGGAELR